VQLRHLRKHETLRVICPTLLATWPICEAHLSYTFLEVAVSIPFGFSPQGNDNNNELAAMFEQMGRMLRQPDQAANASVNWESARDTSRQTLRGLGDPGVTPDKSARVSGAAELAQSWLEEVTHLPAADVAVTATTRTHWLESTFHAWRAIVEPVADGVANAMSGSIPTQDELTNIELPEELLAGLPEEIATQMREMLASPEMASMLAPLMNMAKSMGATLFGNQFGQALGEISAEVLCMSDVGIPLTDNAESALIYHNIENLCEGLSVSFDDVLLYVALREGAHQRLFAHTTWLRSQILAAVSDYARGVQIDTGRIQAAVAEIDPANLDNVQDIFGSDVFEPTLTAEQESALERLELLLALIEGWVTTVVSSACVNRLPSSVALEETFRRRRATGGPAEKLFAGLVGLQIRPRRLREAATLWDELTQQRGIDERDALWSHPDLLPTTADIDNPEGFVAGQTHDLMAELHEAMETPGPDEGELPDQDSSF
jgi:putative hydrolase